MNVTESNNITSTIGDLRKSVYCTEEFENNFKQELSDNICAIDVNFIPEQFGGWAVNAIVNRTKGKKIGIQDQYSNNYTNKVSKALYNAIHATNDKINIGETIMNLANTIITGPDSIVIKI